MSANPRPETLGRTWIWRRVRLVLRKRLVNRGASAVRSSGIDESLSWSLGSERLPVVRQEFIQAVDGVRRDAREHIVKPGERLNAAPFAGSDKASQHCRRLAALVAAEEGPVTAAERDVPVGPFGSTVVDLQLAVVQEARQRFPLVQCIAHRRARWTLRQNFRLQLQEMLMQFPEQPRRHTLP